MVNGAVLILFGLLLAASARLVVAAAVQLAHALRLPSFLVGFFLLGILTSTPEFFVMAVAAADGVPQLSAGNLLGGSILLLSFVIGVSAVALGRVLLNHGMRFGEIVRSCLVISAPIVVLFDGALTRREGALLVGVYAVHVLLVADREREENPAPRHAKRKGNLWQPVAHIAVGVAGMLVASKVVVETAEILMAHFHIAPLVFGLFILSLGTNLPEMALAASAILQGKRDVAFGDFLGSSTANTLILGLLGLLAPFSMRESASLAVTLVLLGSVCAFFVWAVRSKHDVTRREGVGLLVFYGLFVIYQLLWSV